MDAPTGICDGRVVIVTGAGRGIGRGHALEFARQGAKVVVNDLGAESDGRGGSSGPAGEVVEAIRAMGGEAVADGADVADWAQAEQLVATAVDTFGRLDVVVNNAGFLRDRMLANTSEEEWDAVIRVHLKGHFAPTRHAVAHWRERAKAGETVEARIINTSSGAGLMGSVGQGNYSAAKAGIAALTLVESAEFARYGVTANAIAPAARTRMTEAVFADTMAAPEPGQFDAMDPDNVAPLVVWLGSVQSRGRDRAGVRGGGRQDQRGRRLGPRARVRQGRTLGPRRGGGGGARPAGRGARAHARLRGRERSEVPYPVAHGPSHVTGVPTGLADGQVALVEVDRAPQGVIAEHGPGSDHGARRSPEHALVADSAGTGGWRPGPTGGTGGSGSTPWARLA